jgi:hypothetical protein
MITKRSITILILYLACMIPATAREVTDSIVPFREKLMLQTDRNLYIHGDRVWFSAQYFLNGRVRQGQISKIMYLELLNDEMEPVVRKKYRLNNGRAHGAFKIPGDVYTGNYLVRAYTQYQRNLEEPGFAYHQIAIIHPQIKPSAQSPDADEPVRIIAEGGSLVNGVKNKVGIYLNDSLSRIAGSIQVVDEAGRILAHRHPAPNGIHSVEMIPSDTVNYHLRITGALTDTIRKDFPQSKPYGLVTRMARENGKVVFSLQQHRDDADSDDPYTLELYTGNLRRVKEFSPETLDKEKDVVVAEKDMPRGLAYFVLRDKNHRVVRVHSCFSSYPREGTISLVPGKKIYQPREPITLALNPPSSGKLPVMASVSVVRKGTLPDRDAPIPRHVFLNPSLLEHRLMTAGHIDSTHLGQIADGLLLYDRQINNPNFYATLDHPQQDEMTYLPEIRDVSVSGMLRRKETQEPVSGHKVYAAPLFKGSRIHIDRTDEQGRFIISLHGMEGPSDLYLCPESRDNENLELLVDNKFSQVVPDFSPVPLRLDSADLPLIREMMIDQQLPGTTGDEKKNADTVETSEKLDFFQGQQTIYLSDYVEFEKTENVFREIVPHVYLKRQGEDYRFKIERNDGFLLPGEPLILFDNIPVFDPNKILQVKPSQIKSIQVVSQPYILGDFTMNGVIIINSKTDNFADLDFPRGSTFLKYQGVSTAPAFPAPIYRDASEHSSRRPDFRTTLYWNPDLIIDEQGVSVSFSASDRRGDYEIVVRGFDADGNYYYRRKTITVN